MDVARHILVVMRPVLDQLTPAQQSQFKKVMKEPIEKAELFYLYELFRNSDTDINSSTICGRGKRTAIAKQHEMEVKPDTVLAALEPAMRFLTPLRRDYVEALARCDGQRLWRFLMSGTASPMSLLDWRI